MVGSRVVMSRRVETRRDVLRRAEGTIGFAPPSVGMLLPCSRVSDAELDFVTKKLAKFHQIFQDSCHFRCTKSKKMTLQKGSSEIDHGDA